MSTIRSPLPAISIRQPWATAIIELGKDIENRTWTTDYRGRILIHAASRFTRLDWLNAADFIYEHVSPDTALAPYPCHPIGCIIGYADLTDVVTHSASRWFEGPYGFVLANATSLPAIPCRGALGIFHPYIPANLFKAIPQ